MINYHFETYTNFLCIFIHRDVFIGLSHASQMGQRVFFSL